MDYKQESVFPTTQTVGQISITDGGMSLRDWFAGQSLAGMMANCDDTGMSGWAHDPKYTAVKSYELADAMLEARK